MGCGVVQGMTHGDGISEKRTAYRKALDDALARIRERLAETPQVQKAILFGSYAQGRRDLFTDLDLVVVMTSDSGFIERSAELRQRLCASATAERKGSNVVGKLCTQGRGTRQPSPRFTRADTAWMAVAQAESKSAASPAGISRPTFRAQSASNSSFRA